MKIRLADIAERAGVSQATVSRVLSGKSVSAAAREAVLIAVDVLGYERPAPLRRKQAGLVGLIVPELTNPVFPQFAQAIESALSGRGYTPLLCTLTPGGVPEDDYLRTLLDHGAAGIILVSGYHAITDADTARYEDLTQRGMPLVLVNGHQPTVDAPSIAQDDAAVVELAVRHLVELGHRRIGLALGPARYTPVLRRHQAFLTVMADLVPDVDAPSLVQHAHYTVEGGALATRELLARDVTAIVAASDLMALGAVQAVRQAGLSVPGDVSVVGSDDSATMQFTDPPLTTVRQNVAAMGAAAAQALLDEIDHVPHSRIEALYAPELVVRGSTARAPGRQTLP